LPTFFWIARFNHLDVAPESLFLQITALREAEPAAG
jgi:hypothetical protein